MTNKFDEIFRLQQEDGVRRSARGALVQDGMTSPKDYGYATSEAILSTNHPAQFQKTWEEMDFVEKIANGLEAGYHNLRKSRVASDIITNAEFAEVGLSAFEDEDTTDPEGKAKVDEILSADTKANRDFKKKHRDAAMETAKEYSLLLAEDARFVRPASLDRAVQETKGMGFWEGLAHGAKVIASEDLIGNAIYLGTSTFGAIAPYLAMSSAGGGALGAARLTSAARAVQGAIMGYGSYENEYGAYLAEKLDELGYDLSRPEQWMKAAQEEAKLDDIKHRASSRATAVGAMDAISGVASSMRLAPSDAVRKLKKIMGKAENVATSQPRSVASRFGDGMGNLVAQASVQGALGGAGEALGSAAAGDEINSMDVLLEIVGEFVSAPGDTLSLGVSSVHEYRQDVKRAEFAAKTEKALVQMTKAVDALNGQVQSGETLEAWAERIGEDHEMISFAQDLVDNGQVERLREIDEKLADEIEKAAEKSESVTISVGKIMKIATKDRQLANDLIHDGRLEVEGMTPREAEQFAKEGRIEAERQFDRIIAGSKASIQQKREAREVTREIEKQLVEAGTIPEVASMQVKPWEAWLVNRAHLLGVSPREIANTVKLRVANGSRGQAADRGVQFNSSDAGERSEAILSDEIEVDGKTLPTKDSEGNYVGRTAEEVKAFYRWFNGRGDDAGRSGVAKSAGADANGQVVSPDNGTQTRVPVAQELFKIGSKNYKYTRGSPGLRFAVSGRGPRVFYHGTNQVFETVDINSDRKLDSGYLGKGFYLTSLREKAKNYASRKALRERGNRVETVMGAYVRALNPAKLPLELVGAMQRFFSDKERSKYSEALTKQLISQGYDSAYVVRKDKGEDEIELVVFDPNQVKAARSMQDERGRPNTTYSTNNNNMFHQALAGTEENIDPDFKPDNALIERAVETFGTTKDTNEAFYILPDGRMLDGSGRHWGGDERDVAGQRQVDHGDIGEVIDDARTAADGMYKWMSRTGAMRFDQIVGIASIARVPTPEQLAVLTRASKGKYLALSFNTPEGRIVDDTEMEFANKGLINAFFDKAIEKASRGVQGAYAQGSRGNYNPHNASNATPGMAGLITLMEKSDKSTFLHESAHAWLDADTKLAGHLADKVSRGEQLTTGEQEFLRTLGGFFRWGQQEGVINLGVTDDIKTVMDAVRQWRNMSVSEQRDMHELFAEGFESYCAEGVAPNEEMRTIFQRFAQWLKDIYRNATKQLKPLSPEVRKLYDLLFISEQEAADAEARAGMVKLFEEDDERSKLTPEEREQYDKLHEQARLEAQGIVQKAVAGTIRLYASVSMAKQKELYAEHKDRIDDRVEELNNLPRFVAWDILHGGIILEDGARLRLRLNEDLLRREGFGDETISALKKKGLIHESRRRPMIVSPQRLAEFAGHKDWKQMVLDLAAGTKAKKGSELAEARRWLSRSEGYSLDTEALKAEGFSNDVIATLLLKDIATDVTAYPNTCSAEQLAEMSGFDSGVDLITEMLDCKGALREATEQIAAEIRLETGMSSDVYRQYQADIAAHNKTRSRFLTAECNALSRMLGKAQIAVKAAREYAIRKVGGMCLGDLAPSVYMRDEKRCSRVAEQTYRKGDFDACLRAKRGQLVNSEMARASLEARAEHEQAVRRAKRVMKSKTIYKPYQNLIIALIAKHSLANVRSRIMPKNIDEVIGKIIGQLETAGTPVLGLDDWINNDTPVLEMSVDEARNFFACLRELEAIGRNHNKQRLMETKQTVSEIVDEGEALLLEAAAAQGRKLEIREVPKGKGEKVKAMLEYFFVPHIKIQTWCRIFDQNKDGGFFWQLFINSANKCRDFEQAEREKAASRIHEILSPVFGSKGAFDQDKIQIGHRMMSKGERIAVALNLGNESNRKRLVDGEPAQWTDENILELCRSLTKQEWKAVQSIWDLFESYRPQIAAKQMRVYGEEPVWIEPQGFTVTTRDGEMVTVRGGYYPVKYDPDADPRPQRLDDIAESEQALKGAFQSSTTRRSFTKQRVEKPNMGPLRLDLNALYSGIDDVIHDLAWHEWLIDTRRVLSGVNGDGTGLAKVIHQAYGPMVAREFNAWREAIASGGRLPAGANGMAFVRGVTRNVGVMTMGYNVTSALVQLTGLGYAIPRVGSRRLIKALVKFLTHPVESRTAINSMSSMMASRSKTANRNIAEVRNRLENGKENPIRRYAYSMMMAVQGIVDAVTWMSAYEKFRNDPTVTGSENPEAMAASMADQVVTDTQGSGFVSDESTVERSDALRIFTVFYSWANAALNQSYAIYKGEANRRNAWAQLLLMGVVLPIIEQVVRGALKVEDGDDDDDDPLDVDSIFALARFSGAAVAEYHLGLFVGVRESSNAIGSAISGEHPFAYGGPAGIRSLGALNSFFAAMVNPTSNTFANAVLDLVGAATGLPSTQIKKTFKGVRAIESGQAEGIDAIKAPLLGFSGRIDE